jgi:hypothetical protein
MTMMELLKENPWLIVVTLGTLIPILAIIFGTITNYLTVVRKAELEANLKQDMLQRGMSAEDIRMVIEATSQRKRKTCSTDQRIRSDV